MALVHLLHTNEETQTLHQRWSTSLCSVLKLCAVLVYYSGV
jgi:hypothetical protein